MFGYNNAQTQQSSGLTMFGIKNAWTQQFSNWTKHSEQRNIKQLHDFKFCTTVKALLLGCTVRLMIILRSGWMTTGSSILRGAKVLSSSPKHPPPALGPTQSPIQHITGALSPVTKGPKCEADYSLPPSSEVETIWALLPLPQTLSRRSRRKFYYFLYNNIFISALTKTIDVDNGS